MSKPKDVIIACDFSSKEDTFRFLDGFREEKPYVKIGMELFYSAGPDIVREATARGHNVFLDLKLHDIPNTVKRSMKTLAGLGASMVNLHAAGGKAMMEAALEGLTEGASGQRPTLIAVTVLTSLSEAVLAEELLLKQPVADVVTHWAHNAKEAGLDGVVCSPLEGGLVKQRCGSEFFTVTPGIRYPSGDIGDQSRVTTPAQAAKIGSDYIVVGRPIAAAEDPAAAYAKMKHEFLNGAE